MKLIDVIEELVTERGLDRATLSSIIKESLLAAYEKKYPQLDLKVESNGDNGELAVLVRKTVVTTPEDDLSEISLKKARFIDSTVELDQDIWLPFEQKVGRIEILKARQLIASKVRKIEAAAIYHEFKKKEGEIVHGIIHKVERDGVAVKLDEALAFLPKSLANPEDKYIAGYAIKALLKEVLPEPRNDNQLILDRGSDLFLKRLFELEIPEVFEKIVEIKKIVRVPGYKSKVVVTSSDQNIDPVGTCVGVGGSRIKPILKEISGEKIDIIPWVDSQEEMVKQALKPARIDRVEVDNKKAKVWLDEDQRSLAIGKMGQNISLAARLLDLDIQLVAHVSEKNTALGDIEIAE